MATKTINTKICQAANTRAGFGSVVLSRYQLAYETDANMLKVGFGEGLTYPNQPYAQLQTPVGTTVEMAKTVVPDGYLAQNGQAVSRTTYAALFNVIGTRYGAGNGSTTFNLPNPDQKCTWGTATDSQIGTTNGTFGHYHGTGTYIGNVGAVNGNAGTFGYQTLGRDPNTGFDCGVYTLGGGGGRDRAMVSVSYVSHGTHCSNVNTTIVNQVPNLYHVYKVIKY